MSVFTLEKTEPWTKKMKSLPKIRKSMSWIKESLSTKSRKKREAMEDLNAPTPEDAQSEFL